MCECGCAIFDPDFQFPAPDGEVYFLSIRPPCPECDTPVGIIVERGRPDQEPRSHFAKMPPLPFWGKSPHIICAIPIVAPSPLREQLQAEALATEDMDTSDVATALADAMQRTRKKWDEERAPKKRGRAKP